MTGGTMYKTEPKQNTSKGVKIIAAWCHTKYKYLERRNRPHSMLLFIQHIALKWQSMHLW